MSFLPGMFPMLKTPAGGLQSFTLLASATGQDPSIEIPGAKQAGDVCVICNASAGIGVPATVIPSGFTSFENTTTLESRAIISGKVLVGTEGTVTGMDHTIDRWICMVFRPNVPVVSLAWNAGSREGTAGNPAAQNIDASPATPPIILIGQMRASGAISPRTSSPAMTEIAGSSTTHYAHYTIYNAGSTPADNSYDMDDEGAFNILQSGYLSFT